MKDYLNLYNPSDVLLLADVFENLRKICMNHYGLDPAWYFSAPGLANYKISTALLDLLSDSDMIQMIERASEKESRYFSRTSMAVARTG